MLERADEVYGYEVTLSVKAKNVASRLFLISV
jgi:hypothetical protein